MSDATSAPPLTLVPPLLAACLWLGFTRRRLAARTVVFAVGALACLVAVDQVAAAAGWRMCPHPDGPG